MKKLVDFINQMTDKERILTYIINRCSALIMFNGISLLDDDKKVKFEYINSDCSNLKIGDLVECTNFITTAYDIGFVHEIKTPYELVIREIGTKRLCNYSNQQFKIIRNIPKEVLHEGINYEFYRKCQKCFRKGEIYWYAFEDFEITDKEIIIEFRQCHTKNYFKFSIPKQNLSKVSQRTIYEKACDFIKSHCA